MLRLLDSTVLIDYLRGKPAVQRVRELRSAGDLPGTTGINVEEIVRGLRPEEAPDAHQLFAGLEIVPIGAAEGWQAGTWRREFAAQGITLWQADCLIAAAALQARATLVTGNPQDFPIPEITVETWTAGS